MRYHVINGKLVEVLTPCRISHIPQRRPVRYTED
jgi:hypothetical protein